jgi:hypothetical protein
MPSRPGMEINICNPSIGRLSRKIPNWRPAWATGYIFRPCFKKKKKQTNQTKPIQYPQKVSDILFVNLENKH